ncbi:hypothetical protein NIES25_41950 [Nostoc linckia NIES-25]|nr:hypothetical protein NIES25_41950 [Nostoc linckia NIES-25]
MLCLFSTRFRWGTPISLKSALWLKSFCLRLDYKPFTQSDLFTAIAIMSTYLSNSEVLIFETAKFLLILLFVTFLPRSQFYGCLVERID